MVYIIVRHALALNAADIEATRASGCGEAHDSDAISLVLSNTVPTSRGSGGWRFGLRGRHKTPFQLHSAGMFAYGIFLHSSGLVHGFECELPLTNAPPRLRPPA